MFLLTKLKKWIKLEIKELDKLEKDWEQRGCLSSENVCYYQKDILESILYIINNKGVRVESKGHGIFKYKG